MMIMVLQKVKAYVSRNNLLARGDRVVIAVSGGPDSLCLLYLCHELARQYGLELIVGYLNHGLRPEALAEEAGVAKVAAALGWPFEVKRVEILKLKKQWGLSEEAAGREARYRFLREVAVDYGANKIALGHHLDDQAETVFLNILRGCGLDGLAGIKPARSDHGLTLIRPLLCLRRDEIEQFCQAHNLATFTDSSNLQTDYTRNKIRLELLPQLAAEYNPKIRESLFNLAALVAQDQRYLKRKARRLYLMLAFWKQGQTELPAKALLSLDPALLSRVLRLALLRYLPGDRFERKQVTALHDLLISSKGNKVLTLPRGLTARYEQGCLILANQACEKRQPDWPARRLPLPAALRFSDHSVLAARLTRLKQLPWPPSAEQAYLDYDKIKAETLTVRYRQPGDRFYPQGSAGSKKLKDFMIDQKIPPHLRDCIPLVCSGSEIVWVAGRRIADPYRITDQTDQVLFLQFRESRRHRV